MMMMITIITDTSHKHPYTLLAISCSRFLRMKNVSGKSSKGNESTHILCSVSCPSSQNAAQYGTDRWPAHGPLYNWYGACALHAGQLRQEYTHQQYSTFLAFPWKQWLRERVSTLRYTYIERLALHLPGDYRTKLRKVLHMQTRRVQFELRWWVTLGRSNPLSTVTWDGVAGKFGLAGGNQLIGFMEVRRYQCRETSGTWNSAGCWKVGRQCAVQCARTGCQYSNIQLLCINKHHIRHQTWHPKLNTSVRCTLVSSPVRPVSHCQDTNSLSRSSQDQKWLYRHVHLKCNMSRTNGCHMLREYFPTFRRTLEHEDIATSGTTCLKRA